MVKGYSKIIGMFIYNGDLYSKRENSQGAIGFIISDVKLRKKRVVTTKKVINIILNKRSGIRWLK